MRKLYQQFHSLNKQHFDEQAVKLRHRKLVQQNRTVVSGPNEHFIYRRSFLTIQVFESPAKPAGPTIFKSNVSHRVICSPHDVYKFKQRSENAQPRTGPSSKEVGDVIPPSPQVIPPSPLVPTTTMLRRNGPRLALKNTSVLVAPSTRPSRVKQLQRSVVRKEDLPRPVPAVSFKPKKSKAKSSALKTQISKDVVIAASPGTQKMVSAGCDQKLC